MASNIIQVVHVKIPNVGPVEYVKYSWDTKTWFAQRFIPKKGKNWTNVERIIRKGKRSCHSYFMIPELWTTIDDSHMQHMLDPEYGVLCD